MTEFPPIDEPATLAVNEVIAQCENSGRLFRTALEACDDETFQPLLRQGCESSDRVAEALREGLIGTAGEATGEGTAKGFVRRIRENIGQRAGWRGRGELMDAILAQQNRVLTAFDHATETAAGTRLGPILAAKRAVVSGLTAQLEAMAAAL